jgi:hypothetical protein
MDRKEKVIDFLSVKERIAKGLYRESDKKYRCQFCTTYFIRNGDCARHERNFHNLKQLHQCILCSEAFYTENELKDHKQSHIHESKVFLLHKEALNGATRTYRLVSGLEKIYDVFDENLLHEMKKISQSELMNKKRLYFSCATHATFVKFTEEGDLEQKINTVFSSGRSEMNITHTDRMIYKQFYRSYKEMESRLEDFSENGSGWTLSEITAIDLNYISLKSIRGGCEGQFKLKKRRGILTIHNTDDLCLIYCILAKFHRNSLPVSARSNPTSYMHYLKEFNLKNINFPISIDEIDILEKQNSQMFFKVNVFMEHDKDVFLHRGYEPDESDQLHFTVVNVLLSEVSLNGKTFYHYSLIEDENRFFSQVYRNEKGVKCYGSSITCDKCFAKFFSKSKLENHNKMCKRQNYACEPVLEFKKTGEKLKFEKPWLQYPHLFTGFVDFESVLVKNIESIEKCLDCVVKNIETCEHSFTTTTHRHKAVNYCLIFVDRFKNVVFEKCYTGEDAAENFVTTLCSLEEDFRIASSKNELMIFGEEERKIFNSSNFCHICKHPFKNLHFKVRDHCHQTGRFIGAAHNSCNLNRKEKALVKIFAHNFSGYDSHLIVEQLHLKCVRDVSVIPKSAEKFMCIEINKMFTLCDSMLFLTGSLDALSKSLPSDHEYSLLHQSSINQEIAKRRTDASILFKKWKFPYEFAQSVEDLEHCREFPSKNSFYNSLTSENISDCDYLESKKIFTDLKCYNLKQYMEFYCMIDVFLLAEVFTKFREETIANFEIDPCNFISLPGMALQCFMKFSNVELEYIYNGKIF